MPVKKIFAARMRPLRRYSQMAASGAFLGLAACAGTGTIDASKLDDAAQLQSLALSQPAIEGKLSLADAYARGFLYNVSYQSQRKRAFQSLDQVGLTRADYLPRATLAVGVSKRSNVDASVGQRVEDMDETRSSDFFTASDQSRTYSRLSASWNLIDFGMSYLENEKKKRWAKADYQASLVSCSALAGDITSTYWRARAFERARIKNDWLRWRIETGIEVSRQRADANPDLRTSELLLQRELIDLFRWYDSIYVSLSGSKAELAGLLNLPIGAEFDIEIDQNVSPLPNLPDDELELVKIAFQNRPELAQRRQFAEAEQLSNRQDFLRLFPSLSILFGADTDSNSFLLNNSFTSIGANISWNLFELSNRSRRKQEQADRAALFDMESELLANAIAAQVGIAITEYRARAKTLEYAWRANTIQAEIVDRMRVGFEGGKEPETYLVKEELLRELSILRRDVDEAGHQAARLRTLNALGIGPNCSALPMKDGYEAVRAALNTPNPSLNAPA